MTASLEQRIRECIPAESELLEVGTRGSPRGLVELTDGRLLSCSSAGRSVSSDGGKTWSAPEGLRDAAGMEIAGTLRHLQRLKSGAVGGFTTPTNGGRARQYGHELWFTRSADEGQIWSSPVRVSEPATNVSMFGATVTSSGRIVASVYTLVGKTMRQKSRARFGDQVAKVGSHGYEHFFTYCWTYHSDDEGQTWHTNDGKGMWGFGGELFVTLDYSGGGHWRANEPVVAEVSPDHLLMLLRTPLGRLFQSWSEDNGTSWSCPEPTALASALAPASLERIPGTDDLLVIWNQSSADEIERGLQRHRLSTAVSKDGGATWLRGRNIFSVYGEDDRVFVEPAPIGNHRAMELAPRLPTNDIVGTYPFVTFWKDRAIIRFHTYARSHTVLGSQDEVGYDLPNPLGLGTDADAYISLPISWFYRQLRRFG